MGPGFSPLGEELDLLSKHFSPYLIECMVRLGTLLPFEQVPALLHFLTGVHVAADTVRRLTHEAGAALLTIEQEDLEQLERQAPPDPTGADRQQVSADGAMVPLLHGQWAEARTLGIGTIEQRLTPDGKMEVSCQEVSYCSRLCSADAFIRLTALPTHERGTRRAGTVVAVMDGASWLQEVIDEHCPQAIRVLDFPHAVGYLAQAAQAAFGAGSREAAIWLDEWAPTLKTGDPAVVLEAIQGLPTTLPEAGKAKGRALRYLRPRLAQLQYATFREQGLPIGSGMIESACKLVVAQRLKGSGMHWKRSNVSPLLALRALHCSGRWEQGWPRIWAALRARVVARRHAQWAARHQVPVTVPVPVATAPPAAPRPRRPKQIIAGRPTPDHPWRDRRPFPNAWAWRGTATL